MKITVRLDDITPDMDWDKFERFKKVLDEHDIKPLIGVVPDNKDEKLSCGPVHEDFWTYVKEGCEDHGGKNAECRSCRDRGNRAFFL